MRPIAVREGNGIIQATGWLCAGSGGRPSRAVEVVRHRIIPCACGIHMHVRGTMLQS